MLTLTSALPSVANQLKYQLAAFGSNPWETPFARLADEASLATLGSFYSYGEYFSTAQFTANLRTCYADCMYFECTSMQIFYWSYTSIHSRCLPCSSHLSYLQETCRPTAKALSLKKSTARYAQASLHSTSFLPPTLSFSSLFPICTAIVTPLLNSVLYHHDNVMC